MEISSESSFCLRQISTKSFRHLTESIAMNDAKAARAGPSEPRTISLEAAHLSAREKDALLLAVKGQ